MIAGIAKVLFSIAATAATAAFQAELEQGAATVRGLVGRVGEGGGWLPSNPRVDASAGPSLGRFAVAGLVVAGVGVILLPEVRNAILDYHDGALRKLGRRVQGLVRDGVRGRATKQAIVVNDGAEGDLEPVEHDVEPLPAPVH